MSPGRRTLAGGRGPPKGCGWPGVAGAASTIRHPVGRVGAPPWGRTLEEESGARRKEKGGRRMGDLGGRM